MGMAASQARFLSLTARKSNTEYEGQQINQERTALANESSSLYSELSKMDVPTPPNTSDFYKTVYSITTNQFANGTGFETYSFTDVKNTIEGLKVSMSKQETIQQVNSAKGKNANIAADTNDERKFNTPVSGSSSLYSGLTFGSEPILLIPAESVDKDVRRGLLANEDLVPSSTKYEDDPYAIKIGDKYYYAYSRDTSGEKYLKSNYFEVTQANNQPTGLKVSSDFEKANKQDGLWANGLSPVTRESDPVDYNVSAVTTDENGRISAITLEGGKELKVECKSVQDEDAYEQAMLDYEYEEAKYKKAVADLNAKTEKIQEEDKSLELELKQLDTEQNAIKTELDAVTKVVEDNVESTFKTFG